MRFPFTSEEMVFETALPVEEVARRLKERTVSRFAFFRSRAEYPIAGSIRTDSCELFARPPVFVHNSFNRVLALRFTERGSGTVLCGAFRLDRFTSIFMTLWFGMVLLFLLALFFEVVHAKGSSSFADQWSFLPVGIMFFGILLVNFGVWMSRLSEPKVIDFLRDVLGVVSNSSGVPMVGEIAIRPRHEQP